MAGGTKHSRSRVAPNKLSSDEARQLAEAQEAVKIVILTVRPDEEEAVHRYLPISKVISGKKTGQPYGHSIVKTVDGELLQIAVCRSKKGTKNAQKMTTRILADFSPNWLIVCGTSGGFPDHEFSLGDVILTRHCHDLTETGETEDATQWNAEGCPMHSDVEILADSINLIKGMMGKWSSGLLNERPHLEVPSDTSSDLLEGDDDWKKQVLASLSVNFPKSGRYRRDVRAYPGNSISSNVLCKKPSLAKKWKGLARNALNFEMELAGVCAAVQDEKNQVRVLQIRGISDIVGLKRHRTLADKWTAFAGNSAAAFLAGLLKSGIITNHGLNRGVLSSPLPAIPDTPPRDRAELTWTTHLPEYVANLKSLSDDLFAEAVALFSQILWHTCTFSTSFEFLRPKDPARLCEDLWGHIIANGAKKPPLAIHGEPGSGKTTLLAILALIGRRRYREQGQHVDYVNLHSYDELPVSAQGPDDYQKAAKKQLREDFKIIRTNAERATVILFVDGYDAFPRDRIPDFQSNFENELSKLETVRIVAIGRYSQQERFPQLEDQVFPKDTPALHMRAIPIELAKDFVEAFSALYERFPDFKQPGAHCFGAPLFRRCADCGLRFVDLLQLDILSRALDVSATSSSMRNGPIVPSISAAVSEYVRGKLRLSPLLSRTKTLSKAVDQAVADAARYVYNVDVLQKSETDERYRISCWGLLTAHHTIRSFLRAYHVVKFLYDMCGSSPKEIIERYKSDGIAGHVFPEDVNSHCKWLINNGYAPDSAAKTLRSLQIICGYYSDACRKELSNVDRQHSNIPYTDGRIQPPWFNSRFFLAIGDHADISHCCYLLGRYVTGEDSSASALLHDLKDLYVVKIAEIEYAWEHNNKVILPALAKLRMLQCTILISICASTSDRDTQHEISTKFAYQLGYEWWRDLACGFHLQYYGDIKFDHDIANHSLGKSDTLVPFPHTLNAVETKLRNAIEDNQVYRLFDIDFLVICVLAISRKTNTKSDASELQRECLERVLRLCSAAIERRVSEPVYSVATFAARILKQPAVVFPQAIVVKLFELKLDTFRNGWGPEILGVSRTNGLGSIRSGLVRDEIESVAEHTWSAMILAELLLPENLEEMHGESDSDYSKDEVIRILLIHDLPECVTGDYTTTQGNSGKIYGDAVRSKEQFWIRQFSRLALLRGIAGGADMEELWEKADRRTDVNGIIANVFDKLDTLIQLVIYKRKRPASYNANQKKWDAFYDDVREQFKSAAYDHHLTKDLIVPWLKWASLEWDATGESMMHDEFFRGTDKWYGGPEAIVR
jgi:nucleoside phosphorylase/5'-deoxynucleotidase YfbR-like HD superfamily hydrolase/energy-coupling factor transporter ATP-binding protein EcfA2